MVLALALLLSQTPAPMVVQDPLTAKKARVEDCGSSKQCLDVQLPGGTSVTAPDGGTLSISGTMSLPDAGVPASDEALQRSAADLMAIRQLLEQLVQLQQQSQLQLQALKDPGK